MAVLTVLGLAIASLFTPASTDPAAAQETDVQTFRIAGENRFETSVAVSRATWADGEPTAAFIATGERFADALAAPSVAGTYLGPVLLVAHDTVPPSVWDELQRLDVSRIVIIGGPAAVSDRVEQQFDERYGEQAVERLAGDTRFATAAAVATEVASATGIGTVEGRRTTFLADGRSFPDALAVGPASFDARLPVLLTETDALPAETRDALARLDVEHVVIAGGPAAVSQAVAQEIRDMGITVERVAGRDRADTAVQVAEWELAHVGYDRNELVLARGDDFPDSLTVAPKAASWNAPIVLSRTPTAMSYDALQFLVNAGGVTEQITAVGGLGAVAPAILQRAAVAARTPTRTISYFTGTKGQVSGFASFSEHVDWTLVDQRGWSLDNAYRYSQVNDPNQAELRIWLTDPGSSQAPYCVDEWSCTIGDDVYINEENWDHGTAEWNDEAGLDAYRHYVTIHEVGHWIGFGHIDCADYWGDADDGKPAPVMEQQSIGAGDCVVNTWPLTADSPQDPWGEGSESEFSRARDLYPEGDSAPGTVTAPYDTSGASSLQRPNVIVE